MNKQPNKDIIRLARESRGFTQKDLAEAIPTPQGNISKWENGMLGLSEDTLKRISQILKYPEHFFYFDDQIYGPGISGLGIFFHRKRQSVSNKTLDEIHAQINVRAIHLRRLLKSIRLKNNLFRFYDLEDFKDKPEDVAKAIRHQWGLPRGPVANLTKSIENAGGIVIEFDFGTRAIDAISQWMPDLPPLFFVNKSSPGDRLRFSLAHELLHVLCHNHKTYDPTKEDEADKFAAEFLMPKAEISSSLYALNLAKLAALKENWKTAMAAILHRATDLEKIKKSYAQYLWMQMGKSGYRLHEPIEIPREEPSLLSRIIETYCKNYNYSIEELSNLLGLFEQETKDLYFPQKNRPAYLSVVK